MQAAKKIHVNALEDIELCDEIHDVLRSAWSKGDFTHTGYGHFFQNQYAQFCGSIYAFSSSLRNSLKETLIALRLPERSEVICPSWISVEHVQSILSLGLTPIFAEINPYTLSLDYSDVSHKLNANTSAVVLNYPFGFPTDPCTYVELCKHHKIKLIEIVPAAIGSTVDDQFIGTFGDIGIFEMHPNQKYSNKRDCMIVTDNADIHQHFSKKGLHKFSQIDGVLGMHFLETFDKHQLNRKEIAQRYHQCFTKILHLSVLYELANANWVHQMYPIRVSHKIRAALVHELKRADIDFELPETPAHLYSYIQTVLRPPQLMTTERLMREIIFLPIAPEMRIEEQNIMIETIMQFFQKNHLYL
ncbi:MAG: DegT/DnrJ/EryC1/StrS family aminotransferase [Bdellovibrionota bacterium]